MSITIVLKSSARRHAEVARFSGDYDTDALGRITAATLGGTDVPVAKVAFRFDDSGCVCCDLLLDDRVPWLDRLARWSPELAKWVAVLLVMFGLAVVGGIAALIALVAHGDQQAIMAPLGVVYFQGDWIIAAMAAIVALGAQGAATRRFGDYGAVATIMFVCLLGCGLIYFWRDLALGFAQSEDWPTGYADLARRINGSAAAVVAQLAVAVPVVVAVLRALNLGRAADVLGVFGKKKD